MPFATFTLNTLIITTLSVAGTLLTSSLVAYSFARFRYPGRDIFFLLTLSTLMLPTEVTLIPTYLLFNRLGWLDTLPAADRAVLVRRQRLQHLPDAPVLHDHPARTRRRGPHRRRQLPAHLLEHPHAAVGAGAGDAGGHRLHQPLERLPGAADLPRVALQLHHRARPALLPELGRRWAASRWITS